MTTAESKPKLDFIRAIIEQDIAAGRWGLGHRDKGGGKTIVTRFPPEPNGFLHIGHAKAICVNFGVAEEYGGRCHLRFDDTNPLTEEQLFIDAIKEDVRWLGFDWGEHEYYASDYFQQIYAWAVQLVQEGKAYVDDQTAEQIRLTRGTLTQPGTPSPFRDRSVAENLDLLERMKGGQYPDGSRVLRAKIDMASPNINLRDPVMYRILHAEHPRTGNAWCIYPMYDWAHGQSDSIEGITHSLCTLEFEDHRPLYDWFVQQLGIHHPRQIEFSRLVPSYTIVSKRILRTLVTENLVTGWDDPRLPTLRGVRRRGVPPESLRRLCRTIGLTKFNSITDIALLDHIVREDLNRTAQRVMAVLDPLKVVITNYPPGRSETLPAVNNPEDPAAGTREVPFSSELFIEREDFMEDPPKKFFRLSPGREVRLRYAYFITCNEVVKNPATGEVTELRCTYDPATRGGDAPDGRKVKATLHWVSAPHALSAEVRLYDRLFTREDPTEAPAGQDFRANLNPDSLRVLRETRVEPSLTGAAVGTRLQFERLGYFCVDPDSAPGHMVFNRTVPLRDSSKKSDGGGDHQA